MAGGDGECVNLEQVNSEYFTSYEDLNIHELMLKDKPRTLAYKNAIEKNADLIKDKIVIDVGAGTGILSMFAAKAGAKKVYAIEASKLSDACKLLVEHNGLSDIVEVIPGRVEEVQLDIKADIIISEWMGFYLLHESMINSVIVAREKWLKDGGIMWPSSANLYICPVSLPEYHKEHFGFWEDVYGFDFTPLLPAVQQKALSQPAVEVIPAKSLISDPQLVASLDMEFVAEEDVKTLIGSFKFEMNKHGFLHGFACWFDVGFEGGSHEVTLPTGPTADPTHWKQTVMLMPDTLMISKKDVIGCRVQLSQNESNPRRYDIGLQLDEEESEEETDEEEETSKRERAEIIGLEDDMTDKLLEALAKKHRTEDA